MLTLGVTRRHFRSSTNLIQSLSTLEGNPTLRTQLLGQSAPKRRLERLSHCWRFLQPKPYLPHARHTLALRSPSQT